MKYVVATTKGQPKNEFGGRNFKKLGEIEADGIAAAKRAARKQFGADAAVMLPSEWDFLSRSDNSARVRGGH